MIVFPVPIPNKVYNLFQPTFDFSFIDWTDDVTTCGPFKYWAELLSTNPLPSYIQFDDSLKKFSIQSTDPSNRGNF